MKKRSSLVGAFTSVMDDTYKRLEESKEQKREAQAKIVAKLIQDGWEPMGADNEGFVNMMRRPKA